MAQAWPFVLVAVVGALQAVQAPINNQLNNVMKNPWLAGCIVFGTSLAAFSLLLVIFHRPLPDDGKAILEAPWYVGLGGLLGAAAVYAMLTMTHRMGAGAFTGTMVTASIIMGLILDHFGLLGLETTPLSLTRIGGAVLLIAGVVLVSR